MAGLFDSLNSLSFRQRVMFAGAASVLGVALLMGGMTAAAPKQALLYSGLDQAGMSEIVEKLEGMNVPYTMKGDAVYIGADKRDRLRLQLAQEGVPHRGTAGYELLDNVSGFGTTSEMFNAAYWRAKEGELPRTITSLEDIQEARVHLAPKLNRTPFVKDDEDASASVMVRMKGEEKLPLKNARAIRYLVALAVHRLSPARVSVIDGVTGQLIGQEDSGPEAERLQKRLELENKMSTDLEKMIGAHAGKDKVRVNVSAELDQDMETVTEKSIDPESRTAVSTDTGETKEKSTESSPTASGAAPNLPNATPNPAGTAGSNRTETKERVNYEMSEVRRERHKPGGGVKRLTVAVLVDGTNEVGSDGKKSWTPASDADLKSIEDLVKSSTGFNPSRGDVVTVKSLPFILPPEGTPPQNSMVAAIRENLGQIAIAIAVMASAGGLGFGVIRPLLVTARRNEYSRELENLKSDYESRLRALAPPLENGEAVNPTQVAVNTAEQLVRTSPDDALRIIRTWLHEERGPVGKKDLLTNAEMAEFAEG